ncbi:hypothetical protein LguiA_018493 [Lonicera macranthoides]
MAIRVVGFFSVEIAEAFALLAAVNESVCCGYPLVEIESGFHLVENCESFKFYGAFFE